MTRWVDIPWKGNSEFQTFDCGTLLISCMYWFDTDFIEHNQCLYIKKPNRYVKYIHVLTWSFLMFVTCRNFLKGSFSRPARCISSQDGFGHTLKVVWGKRISISGLLCFLVRSQHQALPCCILLETISILDKVFIIVICYIMST